MDRYTFNKSSSKLFFGRFLIFYSKYLRMWSNLFLKFAKINRNRSNKMIKTATLLIEEADGVSFKIQKASLLDRNIMRLSIVTLDPKYTAEKNKYFCYVFGDYQQLFIKNKGGDVEVEESHLYVARDLHGSWKMIN